MSELNRVDNKVAGTHLGQKSEYAEQYDPTLLVAVPRKPNRDNIGVDSGNTPWRYAYDVWNCYEVSSLLQHGQPFSGVGKLVYDGNSECIVESKSLKLYLNSFNQTCQITDNVQEACELVSRTVSRDLSLLLKTDVKFMVKSSKELLDEELISVNKYLTNSVGPLPVYASCIDVPPSDDTVKVSTFTHDSKPLNEVVDIEWENDTIIHTSNLFSRCQITNQPDHGDLFIFYKGSKTFTDYSALVRYISSLRGHSCFHEPTVETIFKELYDVLQPRELMVMALYTRRGGISIAPVRSTHDHLVPQRLINHRETHVKLPRE